MTGLDPEQVAHLRDVLRSAGISNRDDLHRVLCARVLGSLRAYKQARDPTRLTERRRALKALLTLISAADPPVAQIRLRLRTMPAGAMRDLERRARHLARALLPAPLPAGGVRSWAAQARPDELLRFTRALIVEGGVPVLGRLREDGTRRGGKVEPVILGGAKGLRAHNALYRVPSYENGRPADWALIDLIGFLAVDWHLTTELPVTPGRSDAKPFGDLVHQVFGWIGRSDHAAGALRHYWGEARRLKRRRGLQQA